MEYFCSIPVTVEELEMALSAANSLPKEQQMNPLLKREGIAHFFKERGRLNPHIDELVIAIDMRFAAFVDVLSRPELSAWTSPDGGEDVIKLSKIVYQVIATERLFILNGRPFFDPDSFCRQLLYLSSVDGAS